MSTPLLNAVAVTSASHSLPIAVIMRRLVSALVPAYAALVPLVVLPIGTDRIGLCEPLLCLTAVGLLVGRPIARPRLVHIAFGVFLFATLLSLIQIDDPALLPGSALRWLRLVAVISPLFLSLVLPADFQEVRRTLRAFFWGGGAAIACGLVIYWLQIPIHVNSQRFWLANGQAPVLRASGLVGDTAAFGHLISVWGLVALGTLWIEGRSGRIWKSCLIIALVVYADLVSSSRAALLDVAGGCLTFLTLTAVSLRVRRNAVVVGIGVLLLGTGLLLGLSQSGLGSASGGGVLENSITRFVGSDDATLNGFSSGRFEGWAALVPEFSEHPFLGMGYKTAQFLIPGHLADNALLGIALESGLFGLIAILIALGSMLYGLVARHRMGNRYATLLLAIWVGQLLHGLTADTFTLWCTMPMLFLVTGLVLQMRAAPTESAHRPDRSFIPARGSLA